MWLLTCVKNGPVLAKDKNYAWAVLVMATISHAAHLGFTAGVIGNFTVAQKNFYNISLEESTLIGTVHRGVMYLTGPLNAFIVQMIGCRYTQLLGGTLAILGLALSYFATQSWHTFILFGVITAAGISNCFMATSTILSLHFDKYKNLVFAVAALGNYFGMMVWPIVSQHLIAQFGYPKAMLIMSSFHLIHIITGLGYYEPKTTAVEEHHEQGDSVSADSGVLNSEVETFLHEKSCDQNVEGHSHIEGHSHVEEKILVSSFDEDKWITPTHDVPQSETDRKSHGDHNNSALSNGVVGCSEHTSTVKDRFMDLLRSWEVRILLVNSMFWAANTSIYLILLNDFILHKLKSLSNSEVDIGVTIIGAFNTIGCLLVVIASYWNFDRLTLHFATPVVFGVASLLSALSNGKVMYYCLTGVYRIATGAFLSNIVATLYSFCSTQSLSLLIGLQLVAEGVGTMTLGSVCDYLAKHTMERYGIILAGSLGILSSLIILPVIISRFRREDRRALSSP